MKRRLNIVVSRVVSASAQKFAAAILAAMGLVVLTAVSRSLGSDATADQAGWVGKTAPDFALTNLLGQTVRRSDFKGKVVLLDFWATWCAPCRLEIPDLVQLQTQYAGKGFTVLGIALDDEGAAVVKPVAQKLSVNYPVAIGNLQVAAAYGGIEALPTTFLIGRDGKVLKTHVGAQGKSELEREIQSALSRAGAAAKASASGMKPPVPPKEHKT